MATYRITYCSADKWHPMNGDCGTVDSGAAFVAAWPEALPEAGDIQDSARIVDEMATGDCVEFFDYAASIAVERIA